MATLRPGKCYRGLTRPYTRKSKKKKKGFIKSIPSSKVSRYTTGDTKRAFEKKVVLKTKQAIQVRHNALESSRIIINRHLTSKVGPKDYLLRVIAYPHHVLRENKMLTGAHADRLQTGMAHSFGRTIGVAAQLKKDSIVFLVGIDVKNIEVAKEALKKAKPRLPGNMLVEVI